MNKEREIIVGKPSFKAIPVFFILAGVILFFITDRYGWSWTDMDNFMYFASPCISVVGIVLYIYSGLCSIVVTDKRVYGKAGFGSRVDLPFDMISAVGTTGLTHGVIVSTSSGTIRFMYMKNAADIHAEISKILLERQETKAGITNIQKVSGADELKKYKELKDQGVITEEEFQAKKEQLLKLM